jgi:predicted MFS family arabinose efflux permease
VRIKVWQVILLVSSIHFLSHSHRNDVVPFFIELRDLYNVGYAEVGSLVSCFLIGYAVFQIPAGLLADRYSAKWVLSIGLSILLLGSLLVVLANTFYLALVLRFCMGVGSAMLFTPLLKLISTHVPKDKRGLGIAIMETGASTGMLLTLSVFPILSIFLSWKIFLLTLSILIVPVLIMALKLPKKESVDITKQQDAKMNTLPVKEVILNRNFLRLVGISFFGLLGVTAFITWIPTFLETELDFSKQQSGFLMALLLAAKIIVLPLTGKLSDWIGNRKIVLFISSALLSFCSLWLALFPSKGTFIVIFLIGVGLACAIAPMLTIATEVIDVKVVGFALSLINTIGQISAAVSGFIFGLIFDVTGSFQWVWLCCLAAFLIRILFCFGDLESKKVVQKTCDSSLGGKNKQNRKELNYGSNN